MFGLGMPELVVILVVALIVLGPRRLPEVARSIGKAVAEFRRQSSEIMDEFQAQARVDEEAERKRRAAQRAEAKVVPQVVEQVAVADAGSGNPEKPTSGQG